MLILAISNKIRYQDGMSAYNCIWNHDQPHDHSHPLKCICRSSKTKTITKSMQDEEINDALVELEVRIITTNSWRSGKLK